MANESVSSGFVGIVNDIRARSLGYIAQEGVMKTLVTRRTGKGTSIVEPYFDPTATAGPTVGTEGTDYTTNRAITTTRRTYNASEWVMRTIMTDKSVRQGLESIKEFHSKTHGFEHASNLETKLLANLASFTTTITATSTSGLTWAKVAAGRANLENVPLSAPKPYNLVMSADGFYYFAASMVGNANYGPVGTMADSIQQKYAVATLVGGVNLYQSSYFTQATTQKAGMFSKDSIMLFIPNDEEYRIESERDASLRAYELVSTFTHGSRVRVPSYGVTMNIYAKEPS
jgi:hypothetical protein